MRTDAEAVKKLLLRDYDSNRNPDLAPFIETASAFVDGIAERDSALLEPRLELIERWLAAHGYKQSDRAHSSRSNAGASASHDGQTGLGFDSTMYGQTAKRLDPTGYLAEVDAGGGAAEEEAYFEYLGRD